jgi:hypothetical protein
MKVFMNMEVFYDQPRMATNLSDDRSDSQNAAHTGQEKNLQRPVDCRDVRVVSGLGPTAQLGL